MLIRINGGKSGIAEYLENGQMSNRFFTRDDLDQRLILYGDLDFCEELINELPDDKDRYMHITLSFREPKIDEEKLKAIFQEFKATLFSAYSDDELYVYAEAHLPKIKSLTDAIGDTIERLPHIHVVIPKLNLLSGKAIDPLGYVKRSISYIDAIQEKINAEFGLESPKDHRREFGQAAEIISRSKGDLFEGAHKELRQGLLLEMLEKNISSRKELATFLAEMGVVKERNQGTDSAYFNLKLPGAAKGINLNDYVFTEGFLIQTSAEKKAWLVHKDAVSTVNTKQIYAKVQEWKTLRSKEIKYIQTASKFFRDTYSPTTDAEKLSLITTLEQQFYSAQSIKHQDNYDAYRRTHIDDNLRAAGNYLSAAGANIESAEIYLGALGGATNTARIELIRSLRRGDRTSPERNDKNWETGLNDSRNVVSQDLSALQAKLSGVPGVPDAKAYQSIDGNLLLESLSQTHGIDTKKYKSMQMKDGTFRIQVNNQKLRANDFLTREINMRWPEAKAYLEKVLSVQNGVFINTHGIEKHGESLYASFVASHKASLKSQSEQRKQMFEDYRKSLIKQKDNFQRRKSAIFSDRSLSPGKRKSALSIARMTRIVSSRRLKKVLEQHLETLPSKPFSIAYQEYLVELVAEHNVDALAEIQRLKTKSGLLDEKTENQIQIASEFDNTFARATFMQSEKSTPFPFIIDTFGNVKYKINPISSISDSGSKVLINASANDKESLELGLRLAVSKFGNKLSIKGDDQLIQTIKHIISEQNLRISINSKVAKTPAINQNVRNSRK